MAVLAMLVASPAALSSHIETLASSNYVLVGDFGSGAPAKGCGERAALSGGFRNKYDPQTSKLFLFGFNPIGRDVFFGPSWRVTVANRGEGTRGGGKVIGYVYCAKRPPRLRLAEASVPIGPSSTATATAVCPRGTEAVSGGFADQHGGTNGSLVFGFRSMRVGTRGWRASAVNLSDSMSSRLVAIATCSPAEPGLTGSSATVTVPRGGTNGAMIICARGREAWSGGFESRVDAATGYGAYPYELWRVGNRAWRGAAFAEGRATKFKLHVYCGP
jgi:hypothetical protein